MTDFQSLFTPLVYLTREQEIESVHFGAFAVVRADGKLLKSAGEVRKKKIFLRSTAKPFQALPFIEAGGAEQFNFSKREIALMCASHSGTDEHVHVLRGMQARIGVGDDALQCGVHPPYHDETAIQLHLRNEPLTPARHNCSGKHTGMLAYARLLGAPLENYLDRAHPVQQHILHTLAEVCSLPVSEVALGTDGCSAPNFAIPLYNAALGLARLSDPRDLPPRRQAACRVIVDAMAAYPYLVAGPKRFDTDLMQIAGDRLIAKGGAEGYQGVAIRPGVLAPDAPGVGIAVKISDGDPKGRARAIVTLALLQQLGVLTADELTALAYWGPETAVRNWRKLVVGKGGPLFE